MNKTMVVFGTRPEIIKLASVIMALKSIPDFETIIINTGQQKQLTEETLKIFDIDPDYDLEIMIENQSLCHILEATISKLDNIIQIEKPDLIIVQGDTTTTLATALCAVYNKVKVLHIEAGVRTDNKMEPYPEEINRRLITQIADYNVCQSLQHLQNLIKEGKFGLVSGNTGIDALKILGEQNTDKCDDILITMHRRENWGEPIRNICEAVKELANDYSGFNFIISCHPNPIVKDDVERILGGIKNIKIINALPFNKFIQQMACSKLIITDSGSIPQEAPLFYVPVIITRNICENQEILDRNLAVLAGTDKESIIKHFKNIMGDIDIYTSMLTGDNPYGTGEAYKLIVNYITEVLR